MGTVTNFYIEFYEPPKNLPNLVEKLSMIFGNHKFYGNKPSFDPFKLKCYDDYSEVEDMGWLSGFNKEDVEKATLFQLNHNYYELIKPQFASQDDISSVFAVFAFLFLQENVKYIHFTDDGSDFIYKTFVNFSDLKDFYNTFK